MPFVGKHPPGSFGACVPFMPRGKTASISFMRAAHRSPFGDSETPAGSFDLVFMVWVAPVFMFLVSTTRSPWKASRTPFFIRYRTPLPSGNDAHLSGGRGRDTRTRPAMMNGGGHIVVPEACWVVSGIHIAGPVRCRFGNRAHAGHMQCHQFGSFPCAITRCGNCSARRRPR